MTDFSQWRRAVMLSVVGFLLATGCAPGGLGSFGDLPGNTSDDLVERMRDCGLLTAGQAPYMQEATSWYDQCLFACYLDASCDDLTTEVCGTGDPSPTLWACMNLCESQEFTCQDGSGTIPAEWICDGYDDCTDGSDEIGCGSQVFECESGSETIPGYWVCDGGEDCWDGSDERNCPASQFFECHDGSDTIPDQWVCDMYDDCMDGSDELGCAQLICPGGGTW